MFRTLTILSTFSSFFTPLRASTIYPTFSLGNVDAISGSVFNGVSTSDQSGTAVVNAGDINGDGKTDFAIGAPGAPFGGTTAGQVYIVFGSATGFNAAVDLSTLDGNNGFVMTGEQLNDGFGFALAGGRGRDFNGDGIDDIVVGAPYALGTLGKAYLIYGRRSFNATLSMAALGAQGFAIYGYGSSGYTGSSLAIARDFNGNGFSDLVIGATNNAGLVAVVFGTNKTISALNVSALNGTNGFVIPGVFPSGQSGSVAAGDSNGDGLSDIVIGGPSSSPNGKNNAGFVAVVFGANKSFNKSLNVSLLNGTDGFSLAGVSTGDKLGFFVSTIDSNGDGIDDLLMTAPFASPGGRIGAGSLFVLLGRLYFNATVDLSKLNGTDGSRINGQLAGDNLGSSCISGGYINGDSFGDVILGLPYASPVSSAFPGGLTRAGSTFVVFGTNKSVDAVLDLPGSNDKVLRIDGHLPNMNSGFCVDSADIRGDGYGLSALIIGANTESPGNVLNVGSTYVIYGDSIQLTSKLIIPAGGSHILTQSDLNASVPHNPGNTQYTITGIQHVQFEYTGQPGVPITRFSGQDLITGRVNVTHDDSELAPSYLVAALHTFAGTIASPANITFINQLPVLVNKTFIINQGQTIQISPTMLAAVDPNNAQNNAGIVISFLGCSNGIPNPPSFPQSQLLAGGAYFTHDNSLNPPQCSVSISRGGVTIGPTSSVFDFDTTPVFSQNHFDICQGQPKVVTPNMLSAIHPGANSSDTLVFSVNNVQYGYFERVNAPGVAILNFTQAEINGGSIQFAHDGSPNPPSFEATVSDGRITTPSKAVAVYFTKAPVITSNAFSLYQGQTLGLTGNMLNAVNPNLNGLSEDLIFTMSNVEGGTFIKVNTTQNITQFNKSQVSANAIAFRSNGSPNAPSYDVVVANQCSQTQPSGANVKFNSAPEITINELTITKQGQPVIVTTGQLDATDKETPVDDLSFNVSVMQGGCFKAIGLQQCIDLFPRQAVRAGIILFAPDGSDLLPAYNVSVTDGVLWDGPRQALVTLNTPTVVNTPANTPTNYTGAVVGSVVGLGAIVLAAFGANWWFKKKANDQFKEMLLEQGTSEADQAFKKEVVYPIAHKIFGTINTTGCLKQRTEADNNAYMIAITKIVSELKLKNAKLDFTPEEAIEKEAFFNEIAKYTRQNSLRKHKSCSFGNCTRYFRAEATPQEIEAAAGDIAQDAASWQSKRKRGASTKKTTSIELGILSDFPDNAANGDASDGPHLTWQRDMQREQKSLGEQVAKLGGQLTAVDARLAKVEGQSPRRKSVTG